MKIPDWLTLLGILATALTAIVGALIGQRGSNAATRVSAEATRVTAEADFRGDLLSRVTALEDQVRTLQTELTAMTQKYLEKYGEAERLRVQRDLLRTRVNDLETRCGEKLSIWPDGETETLG